MPRKLRLLPAALVVLAGAGTARAQATPGASAVVPVFSIAKSENRNQVQYVVRLDDHCAPSGPAPVSAYWRMLEKGPMQTAPLLSREVRAYGLASQAVVDGDASGGRVRAVLKALPQRPLLIVTSRGADGSCRALATVVIAGAPAHLFDVYVHLRWYGVDYVLLQGWSTDGSRVVREKLK
ncbi:MAG TPA: DUF4833 domain-containing protein [Polyangiaceae bacterium]|jgi:hypothetical protein|nr:DUF4833 domain-containing protein [Polyangiaceae bacterium]